MKTNTRQAPAVIFICYPPHSTPRVAALARVYIDMFAMDGDADVVALEPLLSEVTGQVRDLDRAASRDQVIIDCDGVGFEWLVVSI